MSSMYRNIIFSFTMRMAHIYCQFLMLLYSSMLLLFVRHTWHFSHCQLSNLFTPALSPLHYTGIQEMYKTVASVFETKPVPAAIAIMSMTRDTHGQVLRPGTILFPNRCEKTLKGMLKSFTKKGEVEKTEFTTALGTKVHLPMDCAAGFSTQEEDVKLYLPELMAHVMLPVDVKCFGLQNSRYCNSMNNITLTKVCTEASIIGGLTLEGGKVKDQQFDLPLDLPVKVACIDLTEEDLQRSLYARVKTTYESVDCRFAMHKKVVVNGDECDKAQQEFYSTVRTDIAQDVVTVDVPERIYDEVGFGDAKGSRISNAYKVAQNSNCSGPPVVPRQPSIPPCSFQRSEDEPYIQLVSRAGAAQANASVVPTSSALPHKSAHITSTPVARDIYDEPTSPLCSTNVPHRDAASKMPDLGNPAVPFGVPPSLPAQNRKQQKHTAPPLYSKPLQPVPGLPPKTLPQKPAPTYAEIRPDTLSPSIYAPLMHNKPTRLRPAPAPKPALFKGAQTPPTPAKGSDPSPEVDEAGNIKYLKTLNCNDIIRLLEAMELHQYTDNFMKVSGTAE